MHSCKYTCECEMFRMIVLKYTIYRHREFSEQASVNYIWCGVQDYRTPLAQVFIGLRRLYANTLFGYSLEVERRVSSIATSCCVTPSEVTRK